MTPSQLTKKLKDDLLYIIQKPIASNAARIVGNTPKFSGQARINTRIGIGSPDEKVKYAVVYEKNFFSDTQENKRREFNELVKSIKLGDIVFTTSSLPYINYIEEGGYFMFYRARNRFKHEVAIAFSEAK